MKTLTILVAALAIGACSSNSTPNPTKKDTGQRFDSMVLPDGGGLPDQWVQPVVDTFIGSDRSETKDSTIVTPFDFKTPPKDSKVTTKKDAIIPTDFGGGPLNTLTAPFTLDFEANNGKLVGTRDWQWGAIAFKAGKNCSSSNKPPTAGHSGTKAWGTILNDCHNPLDNAKTGACKNANPGDDSVLKFNVTIPASFTKATMTFWEWADYFLDFDWAEIRVNGAVVKQFCKGSRATAPVWTKQTVDLTAFKGKTVLVSFHFLATGVVNYSGWYIDDLAITN